MPAGRALSEITLADLDGNPLHLGRYQGRRYVLFVWASW